MFLSKSSQSIAGSNKPRTRHSLLRCALIAACFVIATSALALDPITVSSPATNGGHEVHFFNPQNGSHLGGMEIPTEYDAGAFLAGDWLGNGEPSVLSLTAGGSGTLGTVIGLITGPIATFDLGKELARLVALDFNGSGLTDLAIQAKGKSNATLAYDLGSGAPTYSGVPIRSRSDITGILGLSTTKLGTVVFKRIDIPGDPRGPRGSNFIEYLNDLGAKQKLKLPKNVKTVLPVRLNPGDAHFLGLKSKSATLFGTAGVIGNYAKSKNDYLVVGHFDSEFSSSLLIGKSDGTATIVDLSTSGQRALSLVVPSGPATLPTDPICLQAQAILDAISASTDSATIFMLLGQLQQLNAPDSCFADIDGEGGSASGGGLAYIGNLAAASSASTGARGPCDRFLDPRDGNQGFLAKNSDFHPGSVYLTPGFGYQNGRILNPRTLKVLERLKYSGIGNGARAHFRSPRSFPKPVHVFAADYFGGETHCWKVPAGSTRID